MYFTISIVIFSDDKLREDNSRGSHDHQQRTRRRRSISKEYFVETLVVVDHSMVEYYKNEDVNTYIFTIMNMVSHNSFPPIQPSEYKVSIVVYNVHV